MTNPTNKNELVDVIVVDDRLDEQDEVRQLLRECGFNPHFFGDIGAAFDAFRELVADRLLVNYQFGPKNRGRALLERLNRSPMQVPTIVMNCSIKERAEVYRYTAGLDFVVHTFEADDIHVNARKIQTAFMTTGLERRRIMARSGVRPKIFVIYGRDVAAAEIGAEPCLQRITRLLSANLSVEPIVVKNEPVIGKTIIQQVEESVREASLAIALFTADDIGKLRIEEDAKLAFRARQNVLYETGFARGYLGTDRTVIMTEDGVDIPSDLSGVRILRLKKDDKDLIIALRQILDYLHVNAPIKPP